MTDLISKLKDDLSADIRGLTETSALIDVQVNTATELLIKGFNCHLEFLSDVNREENKELIIKYIDEIEKVKNDNCKSKYYNNLNAISECSSLFSWPFHKIKPPQFCSTIESTVSFYLDRIRPMYKDDPNIINCCNYITSILKIVSTFVKNNYPTSFDSPNKALSTQTSNDLKHQLQQGLEITSGLKKVTDDMKTHKNPQLRGNTNITPKNVVPSGSSKPKTTSPPIFNLVGNKWEVGFQNQVNDLVIEDGKVNQSVNMFNCTGTFLKITGKVNVISLTNLKKCQVEIDSVLSMVDVGNCDGLHLQINGSSPSIIIDNSNSVVIYVSEENLSAEFNFTKHSAVAVNVVSPDGNMEEIPVLEQSKGKLRKKDGSFVIDMQFVTS